MRWFLALVAPAIAISCARASGPETVRLAPAPTGAIATTGASALAQRAEACFADPTCPLAQATHDLVAADDAGATNVDCFRFYYGTGVPADAARARACFARTTRGTACDGSPDLSRLYLATMELDAQGGPVDVAGANAAVEGCFADVSVSGVREAKRGAAPVDFCADIGGTTLSMLACDALAHDRATFALQRWQKTIEPSLDASSHVALRAADAAFDAFVAADAARAGDAFRGGSLANLTYAGQRTALLEQRVARFEALAAPPQKTARDVADLEAALAVAMTAARSELDAEGAKLFDASAVAFREYVAREVAFYTDRGPARGANADAVRALLLRDRIESLQ